MSRKKFSQTIIYLIIFVFIVQVRNAQVVGCYEGCQTCSASSVNSSSQCSQCMDGFVFSQTLNKCQTQQCEKYQFTENSNVSSSSNCVSICDSSTIGIPGQASCQTTSSCSIKYIQPYLTSNSRIIQSVQPYLYNQLLVIYSNFFNAVDAQTGSFLRSYTFPQNITLVMNQNNNIYLFSNNNQVFLWNADAYNPTYITSAQNGVINNESQIITVFGNTNRLFIASFLNKDLEVILTEISTTSSLALSVSYVYSATVYSNVIVLQDTSNNIKLIRLSQDQNQQVFIDQITSTYICSNILDDVYQVTSNINQSSFYLTFQNSSGIRVIQAYSDNCQLFSQNQVPIKLLVSQLQPALSNNYQSLLFASFQSNQFQIFDEQTLTVQVQITVDASILDFEVLSFGPTVLKVYILKDSNFIDVYTLTILSNPIQYNFLLSDTQTVLIQNPVNLMIIQSNLSQQLQYQLCVVSEDIQLLNIQTSSTQSIGISIDYQEKAYYNTNTISKLYQADNIYFTFSCSIDGKLVAWNVVDPLSPSFHYSIEASNQSCIDFLVYNDSIGIVLFSSQIILFNVFNKDQFNNIQTNPNQFSGIQVTPSYIFLYYNYQVRIMNGLNSNLLVTPLLTNIQRVFLSKELDIFIQDVNYKISVYTYDAINNVISVKSSVPSLQAANPIIYISLFDTGNSGVFLMYADNTNALFVLNGNLSEQYSTIQLQGTLMQIYQLNPTQYFMLVLAPTVNRSYPYAFQYLELTSSVYTTYYHYALICIELLFVIPMNTFPGEEYYQTGFVAPVSHGVLVNEVIWDRTIGFTSIEKFISTEQQTFSKVITNGPKTWIIGGSQQIGSICNAPYNKLQTMQQIFDLSQFSNLPNDKIQKITLSFKLSLLVIVSQQAANFYNFLTYQFIGTITIDNTQPQNTSIIDVIISDSLQTVVIYSYRQIILKNMQTNQEFTLTFSNSNSIQQFNNGIFVDQTFSKLFVYGYSFVQYDLTLTSSIKISTSKQINFSQCLFYSKVVICLYNSNEIIYYDKEGSLLTLQCSLKISSQTGFALAGDEANQTLYIYSNRIEIYDFSGIYKATFTQMTATIIQLFQAGIYNIAFTGSTAYIISRQYLTLIGQFNPSGATLIKGFYFPQANIIAYITNEIRFGQIKFYDLNTFQPLGSLTNFFTQNKVGKPIKMYYDPDHSFLNYIDQYGNLQTANFGSQIYTDNMIAVPQIQKEQASDPTDYLLDYNMNEIFISNPRYIWRVTYNVLTKSTYPVNFINRSYQIIQNNAPNNSDINSISMLFCDNFNNIFYYKGYQISFLYRFSDAVQEIRGFTQNGQSISLVVFSNYFQIFKVGTLDFSTPLGTVSNINMKQILIINNNWVVFETVDNIIIDYDFTAQRTLFSYQYYQNSMIVNYLGVYDASSTNNFLYISTSDGMVYQYNLSLKTINLTSQYKNLDIVLQFIQYGANKIIFSMQTGNIYEIDSTTLTQLPVQNINQNVQNYATPITETKSQNKNLLVIDVSSDRYFLSIAEEKKLCVFKISDNSLINYLAFPEENFKRLKITNKYLFLSSTFQINIYSLDLQYVGYFRRNTRYCYLTQIIELFDDYFIIVQRQVIETIYIDQLGSNVYTIDSINLISAKIKFFQIINQQTIQIIGVSSQGVFEERISVGLLQQYAQQYTQFGSIQQSISCSAELNYITTLQIQNDFDSIYTNQNTLNRAFYLSVLIDQTIQEMSFLEQSNIQLVLRPRSSAIGVLNISSNSFLQIGSNIYMDSFDIKFVEQKTNISFQNSTQDISIQDSIIQNQQIIVGTTLLFQNKNQVQIQNIVIDTIELNQLDSKQNLNKNQRYALLSFSNIKYLLIENVTINNLTQNEEEFLFIFAESVSYMIIRNVTIQNSIISSNFFELDNIQELRINTFIIENCQSVSNISGVIKNNFIFFMNGVQLTMIHYMIAQNNKEIQIINSNNSYQQNGVVYILQDDSFMIEKSTFSNNVYPLTFQKDSQISLIQIQNTNVYLNLLTYSKNQSNMLIQKAKKVNLINSNFSSNSGVTGASLQLQTIGQNISIQNSVFTSNNALASGGAIYSSDVQQITIDTLSNFSSNSALIGGAIRLTVSDTSLQSSIMNTSQITCQFNSNTAQLYGNNIGTYSYNVQIMITEDETSSIGQLLFQGNLQDIQGQMLNVQKFQSGSNLYLHIQLQNEEGLPMKIDQTMIQDNKYPLLILNELGLLQFEITALSTDKFIEIKGETLINIKEYAEATSQFNFDNLVISSYPNNLSESVWLTTTINSWEKPFLIQFLISFRSCQIGEIPVQISSSIVTCKQCSEGTYSLLDINIVNRSNWSTISCQKCPEGTLNCQSNNIQVKDGYWRENNFTDVIVQCNQVSPDICLPESNSSKLGCAEGYIGPLCETCDTFGEVWNGQAYTPAFTFYTCAQCSKQGVQVIYAVLLLLVIFVYILWSIVMFMNNYIYHARCTYMRFMNLLPFSKSCILDESTYIIKSLINYLQISQVLYSVSMNFVPQVVSLIPSVAGQPMGKVVVSSTCIYDKFQKVFGFHEELKIRALLYILIPLLILMFFFIMISLLVHFKLFNFTKYHKYTMVTLLFFFFQPDSISFFTQALTCRVIGNNSYVRSSLIISCYDVSYNQFQYSVILPMLIFWIIFPLAILAKFIKDTKHSKNHEFCTNKFKYGYFYLEYKSKYYFWEFIRIFYRITIVLVITLLIQLDSLQYFLCIIIISLYITALHIFDPFQSNLLGKIEIFANFIMIINVFFSLLNQQFPNLTFQILISIMHYGIIVFFLTISIQMKLQRRNHSLYQLINRMLSRFLPKRLSQKLNRNPKNRLRVLFLWKKVFRNLVFIREKKVEEQITKINSISRRSEIYNIKPRSKEISLKVDQIQQSLFPMLNPLSSTNYQCSQERFSLIIPAKQRSEIRNNVKSEIQNSQENSETKEQFLTRFETQQGKDLIKESSESIRIQFPNIETSDFEEEVLPHGIYQNKESKINFRLLEM